ncbi:hypothetical protein RPALISO_206 [Ruegeria phage RpAliso]|nr:hypothetical protein RPALISO_206 [Ruegeria phage RpAliso]
MTNRPQWNDPEVQTASVEAHFDRVKAWATSRGVLPMDYTDQQLKELRAVVTLAVLESADAYLAGRYLDDILDWPVDHELLRALGLIYDSMPLHVTTYVHAWVMENNIRLRGAKGDHIRFRVGDAEMQGTILAVIKREARAIVEVRVSATKTSNMTVPAEDVIKVSPPAPKRGGNGGGPTGGTPVASRGGAQLKQAGAA